MKMIHKKKIVTISQTENPHGSFKVSYPTMRIVTIKWAYTISMAVAVFPEICFSNFSVKMKEIGSD